MRERRLLVVLIWVFGLASGLSWLFLLMPADLSSELLDSQRGWRVARAVASMTRAAVFLSPVLLGFSL